MKKLCLSLILLSLIFLNLGSDYPKLSIFKSPIDDPSPLILTAQDMPGYIQPNKADKYNIYSGKLYVKTLDAYFAHEPTAQEMLSNIPPATIYSFFQEWGQEGWCVDNKGKHWGVGYPVRVSYTVYPDVTSAKYSIHWKVRWEKASVSWAMTGELTEAEKRERYHSIDTAYKKGEKFLEIDAPPLGDESWTKGTHFYLRKGRIIVSINAPDGEIRDIAQKILTKIEKSKLY